MNREEFTNGYERLCRGFKIEATDERAEATFRAIRHWSGRAWEEAVDVLLVEPRMPDRNRLLAAVDAAAERIRIAARPEPYLASTIPVGVPNREYGQARLDLIKLLLRGKLSKAMLADRLFDLADQFPDMADTLVEEAARYADEAALREAVAIAEDSHGEGSPFDPAARTHTSGPPEAETPLSAPEGP